MPREFPRSRRVGEEVRRLIGEALQRDFSDPRLAMVTITDVEVSRDLSQARVFFSALDGQARMDEAGAALRSASGRLRHLLGQQLKTRNVPSLQFVYDDSLDRGARISALLAGDREPGAGES